MGNPKNTKPEGCVPTSSECVIWQGPDIPFMKLCKGDSISVVVAGVANKVCDILTMLSPNSYDTACLDISGCNPKNFTELLQYLIDEICTLKTSNTGVVTNDTIAQVEVGVASCLQGMAGATFLPIDEMVTILGRYVCSQTATITNLNSTISGLTNKISNLESQVAAITG